MAQSRGVLEAREELLSSGLLAMRGVVDRARQAQSRDITWIVKRLATERSRTTSNACFRAWYQAVRADGSLKRRKLEGLERRADSAVTSWLQCLQRELTQRCFVQWHMETQLSRIETRLQREGQASRRAQSFATAVRFVVGHSMSSISQYFLSWRLILAESHQVRFKDEVGMMVEILQESTQTCKELRTQLLTIRGGAGRAVIFMYWSVFHAWRNCLQESAWSSIAASQGRAIRAPAMTRPALFRVQA